MKKRMLKSVMAQLLVLCMCMGLLSPMAVFAADFEETEDEEQVEALAAAEGEVDDKEEVNGGDPTVIHEVTLETDLKAEAGEYPLDHEFYINVVSPEGVTVADYDEDEHYHWFEGDDAKIIYEDAFKAGETYSYRTLLCAPEGYNWGKITDLFDLGITCTNLDGEGIRVYSDGFYPIDSDEHKYLETIFVLECSDDEDSDTGSVTFNVDDKGYDVAYPAGFEKNTAIEFSATDEGVEIADVLMDECGLDWDDLMEITATKNGKTYVLRWKLWDEENWTLQYSDSEYELYADNYYFYGEWVEKKVPVSDSLELGVPTVGSYNDYESAPPFTPVFDPDWEFSVGAEQVEYYVESVCYLTGDNEVEMGQGDVFEAGVTYTAYLEIYPNWTDGYYYDVNKDVPTITINGKAVEVTGNPSDGCYYISYTFTPVAAETFNLTLDYNLPTGESKTATFTKAPKGMMINDICALLLANVNTYSSVAGLSEYEAEHIKEYWYDNIPEVNGYSACYYFTYGKCSTAEDYFNNIVYEKDHIEDNITVYICWAKDLDSVEVTYVDDLLCGDQITTEYDDDVGYEVQNFTGNDRDFSVYFNDGIEFRGFYWVESATSTDFIADGDFEGGATYYLRVFFGMDPDVDHFGVIGDNTKLIYRGKDYPLTYEADGSYYAIIPIKAEHVIPDEAEPVIKNYKAPTCTADGSQDKVYTFKCENCGKDSERTIHEILDSPGHDWSDWKVVKEATETKPGLQERECESCHIKETEVIPAGNGSTETDDITDPEPSAVSANIITKNIDFKTKDEKGKAVGMVLTYNSAVTYNGQKHVSKDYDKTKKGVSNDLNIKITLDSTLSKIADVSKIKYKNNKLATVKGKEPYYTIALKAKKGITKEEKNLVGSVNKELKAMQFGFDIAKFDITGAKVTVTKDKKGEKVKKVTVNAGGSELKLSKKDFEAEIKNGKAVIKGKNNFTGTFTEK